MNNEYEVYGIATFNFNFKESISINYAAIQQYIGRTRRNGLRNRKHFFRVNDLFVGNEFMTFDMLFTHVECEKEESY
jgi:hypothetical protein